MGILEMLNKEKANVFTEYALVFVLVTIVLIGGLTVYFKRGAQGRIKDLTDAIISSEQYSVTESEEYEAEMYSRSETTTDQQTEVTKSGFTGGATGIEIEDTKNIIGTSHSEEVVDEGFFFDGIQLYTENPVVDSDAADFANYEIDHSWEELEDIAELVEIRDGFARDADTLEQVIAIREQESQEVIDSSGGILDILSLLPGFTHEDDFNDLTNDAQATQEELEYLNGLLADLRYEIELVDARIACLSVYPDGPC